MQDLSKPLGLPAIMTCMWVFGVSCPTSLRMLIPERGQGAKRLGVQALQAAAGAPGRPSGWEDLRHRRNLLGDPGWDSQASGDLEAAPSVIAGHIRASNADSFHAPPACGSVTKQEVYFGTM